MKTREKIENEETQSADEELSDLPVAKEQTAETKGGASPVLAQSCAKGDHILDL